MGITDKRRADIVRRAPPLRPGWTFTEYPHRYRLDTVAPWKTFLDAERGTMFQDVFGSTAVEMAEAMLYEIWCRQPNQDSVDATIHFGHCQLSDTITVEFIVNKG